MGLNPFGVKSYGSDPFRPNLELLRLVTRNLVPPFVVPPLGGPPLKGELRTTVVWVGEALHGQALELLDKRHNKDYSLCDAVSFIVMRQRGLAEALTTDHHFAQEGFQQLLGG